MQVGAIQKQWDSYRAYVVPRGASAVQVQESERAFYAGAQAVFAELMGLLTRSAEPTAAEVAQVDAIRAGAAGLRDARLNGTEGRIGCC